MIERLVPLLVSFLSRDFGVKVRRARRNGLLYLVVGLLLLIASSAAMAGAVVFLADAYGTVTAMFALAVTTLALAVALLAGILIINRNDRKLAPSSPVGGALLAVAATSLLPMILRSRFMTGAATLGTIAFLASRISPDSGDEPPSPT
ncbi:hypothetical protein [Telmatospirillum sp.]|uniref:hypothetical protein n=1 Tax=Telmatospirillum sp. TaxID=2079197 RepID=UPI002847469D|nr:hypothetical protein [Telmatospirillum sp.]MDR3436197.1 hypothetical protein [Telmatospirillum sp.]